MIDPRLLRDDPDAIRDSLSRRGSKLDLDAVITIEASLLPARTPKSFGQTKGVGREIAGLEGGEGESDIAVSDLAGQVKEAAGEVDRWNRVRPGHPRSPKSGGA